VKWLRTFLFGFMEEIIVPIGGIAVFILLTLYIRNHLGLEGSLGSAFSFLIVIVFVGLLIVGGIYFHGHITGLVKEKNRKVK